MPLVSDCFWISSTTFEDLATYEGISLGQKIVNVHYQEKNLMEQVVYNFGDEKEHQLFCYN